MPNNQQQNKPAPETNPTWAYDTTPPNTVAGRFITTQSERTIAGARIAANDNDLKQSVSKEQLRTTEAALKQAERQTSKKQWVAALPPAVKSAASGVVPATVSRTAFYWISAWHTFQWLNLQLTLGVISTAMLGLAMSLEETWVGRVVSDVAGAANAVTSFVGLDFSGLNPLNIFLIIYTVTLGLMLLSLLATMCSYLILQNKPLSGAGTGLKYGAIIIAIVGYAVPVANLFPWIFLYLLVMRRYPR